MSCSILSNSGCRFRPSESTFEALCSHHRFNPVCFVVSVDSEPEVGCHPDICRTQRQRLFRDRDTGKSRLD